MAHLIRQIGRKTVARNGRTFVTLTLRRDEIADKFKEERRNVSMADRDLEKDVISFVKSEVPPPRPKQITLDTEFDRDLRMIWEDVDTLLYKFFNEFKIDYSSFELTCYFPAPRYFIFNFNKRVKPNPLTIRMLVDAAARGAWSEKPITP